MEIKMKIIIILLALFLFSCTTHKYLVAVDKNNNLEVYYTDDVLFVDSVFNVEFKGFLKNDTIINSIIFYEIRIKTETQSKSVYYERKK